MRTLWAVSEMRNLWKQHVQRHLESVSFITWHYTYFLTTCTVSAIIFWGSSTTQYVRFIDSFFLVVSAMTEAGLNTINLSLLNTWQQIMLFLLIIMGSSIFVSSAILHIRKRAFEKKLEELAEGKQRRLGLRTLTFSLSKRRGSHTQEEAVASGAVRGRAIRDEITNEDYEPTFAARTRTRSDSNTPQGEDPPLATVGTAQNGPHITFERPPQVRRTPDSIFSNTGVTARGFANHPRNAQPMPRFRKQEAAITEKGETTRNAQPIPQNGKREAAVTDNGGTGYVGRNSQFHHLSEKERRKLGGIEYDAICLLSYLVPLYFVLFQLSGAIGIGAWMRINRPEVALRNGLDPFWTGAFFAVSAFNNSGMALLDANATALQTSYYCLLTLSLLILAGNTCFPPFLRLSVWILRKAASRSASPRIQKWRTVLDFILDHPRRVYTNLFPAKQTWWLVLSLVLLNGIDWLAFEVLNLGNPTVTSIAPHFRVLDGLFQAFAVRSGGFYVVPIAGLYPGLLILYVLMMYISAFPVTMTIRNTNVYEERSLGIFSDEAEESEKPKSRRNDFLQGLRRTLSHGTTNQPKHSSAWTDQDFVRQQLRGQLGHDLWWIALAVMFIAIVETGQFNRDPVNFSIFNILFEVVSAYGCVGISVGVPWNAYSFCGAWHTTSKLILCAVMLRGRHRGLPVAIDRAILLPSQTLAWAEEEDAHRRMKSRSERTRSEDLSASAERKTENGDVV